MSDHRAIAEVTSALQQLLQTAIGRDTVVQDGKVTSNPPDQARRRETGNQVNLFLYRTAVDPALRNDDPDDLGGEPVVPPLPLVLSYVVTAYGASDDDVLAHRLLGIAMSTFHDNAIVSRQALGAPGLDSGVDRQREQVKITPGPVPQDELSRMWSTFGTGYRISATYDVAVVTIDSTRTRPSPPPVLQRGEQDTGPAVSGALTPYVTALLPYPARPDPDNALAATFVVQGGNLAAVTSLTVQGPPLKATVRLRPESVSDTELRVEVAQNAVPSGSYLLYADLEGIPRASAAVPFSLAPTIVEPSPIKTKLGDGAAATVRLTCSPAPEDAQRALLVVQDKAFPALDKLDGRGRLQFRVAGLGKGTYPLRLRVDGLDSVRSDAGRPAFHELVLT